MPNGTGRAARRADSRFPAARPPGGPMSTEARYEGALEALREHIDGLWIVDTHEHLSDEAERSRDDDVLVEWLRHYFSCDLVSAGLSDANLAYVRNPAKPLMDRWDRVEPYWRAAESTGYGRALDIAAREIYGVEGVTRATIDELNRRFVEARDRGGHYRRVLKEMSRIAISIVDSNLRCDREFFASVSRVDGFLIPSHRTDTCRIGDEAGVKIHTLDDWKHATDVILDRWFDAKGVVALKCGVAYQRSLRFEKVSHEEAERAFNEIFCEDRSPAWRPGTKPVTALQDHMMHHCLAWADRRGATVQIHTGIQEGNGNVITQSNPVHLTNLFLEYGDVKFDVFHMGYPYQQELSVLAKNFRNVYIDMCWGHIISPEAARRALVEWLDAVPANKIMAFGGDYCLVDGVYGHQKMARGNVASSLAQKVADGSFDLDRARQIAGWVFYDNPVRLFGLADRVRPGPG
jgi:hypothetical protein